MGQTWFNYNQLGPFFANITFLLFLIECKKNGTKLLLFPEGTVRDERDGNFLPFKRGGFLAAIASQVRPQTYPTGPLRWN